jgi:outer membrane protein assembly factor BamD (BamD/ComL family)
MRKPLVSIPIPLPFCGTRISGMKSALRVCLAVAVCLAFSPMLAWARSVSGTAPAHKASENQKYVQQLSRELKGKNPTPAYEQLSAFALRKSSGALGLRVALALGYYDYSKGRYPQAAKWLERAKTDPLLRDYSLYWSAENDIAQNRGADALAELKQLRQEFPDSVMRFPRINLPRL